MPKKGEKVVKTGEVGTIKVQDKWLDERVDIANIAEMSCNDAVRAALLETGTTQAALSQKLGYEGASTLSLAINSKRMSVEKFLEMLNGMGYCVLVGKKVENNVMLRCIVK